MGAPPRAVPGGITRLQSLLEAYPRQIEFDLRRYCGVDLRDLWRPRGGTSRLTYRLLGVLIDGLPGESLTKTAIRDQVPDDQLAKWAEQPRTGHGPWSHADLLIAALIDRVELLRRDTITLHGAKPPGEFQPVRRPGMPSQRKRALTPEGLSYLRRLREAHAQQHGYHPDTGAPLQQLSGGETG